MHEPDDAEGQEFQSDPGKDNIDELLAYVDDHPRDHEHRWRLAKKLYMAWEYKRALEHLVILKEEWHRKLNVQRYLAATYYRLGRYDDSIKELTAALETWPEEVGLREQLARVYEVSGKHTHALAEWKKILALEPGHATAEKALARLQSQRPGPPGAQAPSPGGTDAIDLAPKVVCPHCGTQNSAAFDRCWHCHTALLKPGTPTPMVVRDTGEADVSNAWLWTLALGLSIVAFTSLDVYLTLREMASASVAAALHQVPLTVDQLLRRSMMTPRFVLAGVLVVGAYIALQIGANTTKATSVTTGTMLSIALLVTALGYAVSFAPVAALPYAALLSPVISLVMIAGTFGIGFARSAGIWAVQTAVLAVLSVGVVVGFNGPGPFLEFGAISRHAAAQASLPAPGVYEGPVQAKTPCEMDVSWQSTGSPWLDRVAGQVAFEFTATPPLESGIVKVMDGKNSLRTELIKAAPARTSAVVKPGQTYQVVLKTDTPTAVSVNAFGVLVPTFGATRSAGLSEVGVAPPPGGTAK